MAMLNNQRVDGIIKLIKATTHIQWVRGLYYNKLLVGGFNHLEQILFNGKDYPINMENIKCLKPPTRN